jgi:type IV pilus biogenesis protein CpaD/CtpE
MRTPAYFVLALAGLSLAGCALDPFQQPYNWSATGAARQNLAAQAATPAELISGQSSPVSNGVAASAGIDKALGGAAGTAAGLQTAPPALTATLGSGS